MAIKLKRMEDQIQRIKQELVALGFMRPGSITRQYRLPKERMRPFYQISYTYRMRSRSEYVRPENVAALRKETANFRRFRKLIDRWVGLALAASQLRFRGTREKTYREH